MLKKFFFQRRCRIDLKHKAHSTVIENPNAGKSSPNRGIACLTPVTDESFLSGGHDKLVYHWKVPRVDHRRRHGESFLVSSTRLPTEHVRPVHALAYSSWDETFYSAAGDRIAVTKLDAATATKAARVSGIINQVHIASQHLIALEVSHQPFLFIH